MVIAAGVLLICYAPHVGAQISADLEVVDLSQKEIRIFNQTKKLNAHLANRLMIDSLFLPHEKFWTNYVGGEKDFLKWVRESVYPNLKEMNRVNNRVNRKAMLTNFKKLTANKSICCIRAGLHRHWKIHRWNERDRPDAQVFLNRLVFYLLANLAEVDAVL